MEIDFDDYSCASAIMACESSWRELTIRFIALSGSDWMRERLGIAATAWRAYWKAVLFIGRYLAKTHPFSVALRAHCLAILHGAMKVEEMMYQGPCLV